MFSYLGVSASAVVFDLQFIPYSLVACSYLCPELTGVERKQTSVDHGERHA